jgi:peptide/nickel transport system substrate-binding protein
MPVQRKATRLPRTRATLLIGLLVVLIAASALGSLGLLTHFGVLGAHSSPSIVQVARGGTWTSGLGLDVVSLIPNGAGCCGSEDIVDQALYLPLFYADAQGVIQPGAATEVPTIGNGGVSTDATTWTFHLRPALRWSDGQPYDARDVDFTWKLWANPKFGAASTVGLNLISRASVSADHLSITFHLTRPFAPFLATWVDGLYAPLPAHHFSQMAPEQILKSSENLNPKVVSGPFMMAASVPGDHYTVVRNPNYYLAREGLPYLDQIVFTPNFDIDPEHHIVQVGSLDNSAGFPSTVDAQTLQLLKDFTLSYQPTQSGYEALYFNFHNQVLASHLEVRQAMAMAVDQQTIITQAMGGLGTELCTDHASAYHPGYDPNAPCPVFDLAAANKLLDDAGWVRGSDGVRTKGGQRLEFEYSTSVTNALAPRDSKHHSARLWADRHQARYPGLCRRYVLRVRVAPGEGIPTHRSRGRQV